MIWVMVVFIALLLMGMPVAFAIGIAGTIFFLQNPQLPFTMIIQLPISQTQNFPLLAIPLFIFAANLMNETGITFRLIRLAGVLAGHLRGGLAQVNVVLSTLMGGVSGSAIADAAMEARILGIEMLKKGFSKGYTTSVTTITACITPIIPPSIGLILYGTIGEVSSIHRPTLCWRNNSWNPNDGFLNDSCLDHFEEEKISSRERTPLN